jgi:cytochrome P450
MKVHRLAKEAFVEWGKYMEEMRDDTADRLRKSQSTGDGTLLENLVRAGTPILRTADSSISPAAILGNIFIFILAGHETSANTLTYAISLLACRPKFQKSLQTEIDELSKGRKVGDWSYENDYTKLMGGHIGALMKEILRLYTVLPFLPKINNGKAQMLKVGQKECILPADTLIMVNTSATHRNPKYWPAVTKTAADGAPYPLSSFEPERWLSPETFSGHERDRFDPVPGTYVPFAEGFRSCIGQQFARAEFCATIVAIFSEYSVALATEPGQTFEDALSVAEQQLSSGVGFELGLKLKKPVPLKLVKRIK